MSTESGKKFKSKKREQPDDSVFSHNHSKSVKFRLRVQQEDEAAKEIREYLDTEEFEEYYNKENNAGKSI